jgi:nucleotide-binding universal stress UspA family protein
VGSATDTSAEAGTPAEPIAPFERAYCGIDGTAEAVEAATQLARLTPGETVLHLVAAVNPGAAAPAGVTITRPVEQLEDEANDQLSDVATALPPDARLDSRVLVGPEIEAVRAELERAGATVVAVGSPPPHRVTGAVLGSVATALLHESPCSILVARATPEPISFPRAILVGLDGSPGSTRALAVACELRDRLGVPVRALIAKLDDHIDVDLARKAAVGESVELEELDESPATLLVEEAPDLLVVGSRGLHGLRALGSVSERVAHRSSGSVLVVR